jgi:hypothetical protein
VLSLFLLFFLPSCLPSCGFLFAFPFVFFSYFFLRWGSFIPIITGKAGYSSAYPQLCQPVNLGGYRNSELITSASYTMQSMYCHRFTNITMDKRKASCTALPNTPFDSYSRQVSLSTTLSQLQRSNFQDASLSNLYYIYSTCGSSSA